MFASPSLPCNAITGRSSPLCEVCPGGRAITQLVLTPPRAFAMNETVSLVGRLLLAVDGSKGLGDWGCACESSGSTQAFRAQTPAAAALALAPIRSTARRFKSRTRVIMPRALGFSDPATPFARAL